ncbi:hypothetical protein [Roseinatronobacter bogoriensis]|nr:hypothetical protein [Rhodobaca]MBB4209715.1 hypothetical protein [Rhodobaca bogoriensis DSM 18756]TDW33733.1 hypothetical protein LY39_03566 [Rhodobaca barguzinensis]TDY66204.1 hypothetical protein EV660_11357 [Rhodobaca bogoriensis DSM 18756]
MVAKTQRDAHGEYQALMFRPSAVVPLMLCGIAGAFISATIVFALGKSLGVVLIAYIVGGSTFALVGALPLLITGPKNQERGQTKGIKT